ncbi:uncharacterized protein LOC112888018 isoform X2 [Panicum hallii]|uniref:uncharacterized protein LOC112888018 isoform X2 n=1 Tax=Panicum hallii TaxID=206008 RepID=UPI000DF4E938|nr:uncharacterized protein LOC112888018 isoform X2 [Panicum hallii]
MPKLRSIFTVLILMLLLLVSVSSGQTATIEGNHEDTLEVAESSPSRIQRHGRRVLTDIQDYDYGGSNPKHDPRRKPGNGHSR